jgi:signal transduction histidine kinase
MPDGGTITVTGMSSPDGKTVVSVSDSGCGIDEADKAKVFDALHTTKAGGAGLGLSLCRDILQRHDGTIRIESDSNVGTKVVMTLPAKIT